MLSPKYRRIQSHARNSGGFESTWESFPPPRTSAKVPFPRYWHVSGAADLCFPVLACEIQRSPPNRFPQLLLRFKLFESKK